MAARLKIGDYFLIPLPDGRFAYCQYVNRNEFMGMLVKVFDRITPEPISSISELEGASELFPPVFVALRGAVKSGGWKLIGNSPVTNFSFPLFKATSATKPGVYDNWYIWDGRQEKRIGKLPAKFRALEHRGLWGYETLAERIATGFTDLPGVE